MTTLNLSDYSLVGKDSVLAVDKGLADADWYASPVSKDQMRKLLERRDGPAIRDTLIWFGLLIGFGLWGYAVWGTWWAIIPFALYSVIYGSTSDSRWHESSHGTAFKTDWMNNVLYEIASFMVMRESTLWRWSHTRHHSDTIIVGRDPEIAVPRPPDMVGFVLSFFNIKVYIAYFKKIVLHSTGRLTDEERTFIPEPEYDKIYRRARIYVLIYLAVIGLAIYTRSFLPLMYIGLPNLFGTWLMPIYGYTQHAGLAENVLDHRLNCRTVYMNRLNRYLYWNMNFHVEHHMFPLVPYHALPRLHELVKSDMPKPYNGLIEAWREIIPAVLRQVKDPAYYVRRSLPTPTDKATARHNPPALSARGPMSNEGWIEVCNADQLNNEDVVRFDHDKKTFAIYRTDTGGFHATDGICTHGNTHLADGMVKGKLIECAKHNGRFDVTDGSPQRKPVCIALRTYPVRVESGKLLLNLRSALDENTQTQLTYTFRVVSNDNVATYIKELVLDPVPFSPPLRYRPGDYLQINIPAYGTIPFKQIDVQEPFARIWRAQHVYDLEAKNDVPTRRNYSLATNPAIDRQLRFNVRIALPPRGQQCSAGIGSSYVFGRKPGDTVTAIGPFGEFHIKDTENEMVYLGGGAGMAPLRSHISHLLETLKTGRKISYWYGARSLQELFYRDYFENLCVRFPNFRFHVALSEPQPEDHWTSHTGFIHEVLKNEYLASHENLGGIEFYLCGPPALIKAGTEMLGELKIEPSRIAYDEFS